MSSDDLPKPENETLPFLIDHVPEFFQRKCEKELGEIAVRKSLALLELRCMLQENQTTNGIDFLDDFLVRFLRRHKYKTKDALKMIVNCVSMICGKHKYLKESVPDRYFQLCSSDRWWWVLPNRCPDGCTIVLTQPGLWYPDEFPVEHYKQLVAMIFLQLMRDPMTQINGIKFIHDFEGTSFRHLKHATPQTAYVFYQCTMNCIPFMYKGIHVINTSIVVKTFWNLFEPFLTQKMRNRVHFHSRNEELLDYFPRSVLPVEYGGDLTDLSTLDWVREANEDHKNFTIAGRPNYY